VTEISVIKILRRKEENFYRIYDIKFVFSEISSNVKFLMKDFAFILYVYFVGSITDSMVLKESVI
jgi:hypothetical protein